MSDDKTSDGYDEPRPPNRWLGPLIAVVLVVVGIGVVTTLIGIGPFGYRLFKYGTLTVFVYNGTPHFAEIDADGTPYEIKPYEGQSVELTGGDIEIVTTLHLVENDENGKSTITDKRELLETMTFHADGTTNWFYHIATKESLCLAMVDMSSYYDSSSGGEPKIASTVFKNERLQRFDGDALHYPREILPDQATPPIYWLGPLACEVLEEPHLAIVDLRIKAEEARELLERKRREQKISNGP